MKYNYHKTLMVAFGALLLQGCIAFPPLVQVEHKHEAPPPPSNEEVLKRLDAIDNRLNQIEKEKNATEKSQTKQ